MSDSTKKTETFILNIYNRQNATWQGSVTWVEKKEKQQFRSAFLQPNLTDIRGEGAVHDSLELTAEFAGTESGQLGALGQGQALHMVLVDELQYRAEAAHVLAWGLWSGME